MSHALLIEPMQAEDIAAAIAVQRESFEEHLHESHSVFADRFSRFGEHFFVVREPSSRALVGYALSFPWLHGHTPANDQPFPATLPEPDCFYLHDITLLPACRGRGAAAALLDAILDRGRSLGFDTVCLVSVEQAGSYWDRQQFVTLDNISKEQQQYITTHYGKGARLMQKIL